jgi:hypothetical protein
VIYFKCTVLCKKLKYTLCAGWSSCFLFFQKIIFIKVCCIKLVASTRLNLCTYFHLFFLKYALPTQVTCWISQFGCICAFQKWETHSSSPRSQHLKVQLHTHTCKDQRWPFSSWDITNVIVHTDWLVCQSLQVNLFSKDAMQMHLSLQVFPGCFFWSSGWVQALHACSDSRSLCSPAPGLHIT